MQVLRERLRAGYHVCSLHHFSPIFKPHEFQKRLELVCSAEKLARVLITAVCSYSSTSSLTNLRVQSVFELKESFLPDGLPHRSCSVPRQNGLESAEAKPEINR